MGWWKCDSEGGIDFDNKPSGAGEDSLLNAIPDRDTPEDYYNGDAPADAMYYPLNILKGWLKDKPKPNCEQLTKLFTEKVFDPIFNNIDREKLEKLIDETWESIDDIYLDAWERHAYQEERVYICKFCFGGADDPPDDPRFDFWEFENLDRDILL